MKLSEEKSMVRIFRMCVHSNPLRCSIHIDYLGVEVKIYDMSWYGTAYHKIAFIDHDPSMLEEMEKEIKEILE